MTKVSCLTGMLSAFLAMTVAWASENPNKRYEEAVAALQAEEAGKALTLLSQLKDEGWHAPGFYHNLGVAHFFVGEHAQAALRFHQARLLEPSSRESAAAFEESAESAGLSASRERECQHQVTAALWYPRLILAGAALGWMALLILPLGWQRPAFRMTGGIVLGLALLMAAGALTARSFLPGRAEAWIIVDDALIRASHADGTPEVGTLRAGEPVEIGPIKGDWAHVTSNASQGWLKSSHLERLTPWYQ